MGLKIIDSREPFSIRKVFLDLGWDQQALPTGDWYWESSTGEPVGLERKAISDILGDLGGARKQLANLVSQRKIPILLIEGPWGKTGEYISGYQVTWAQAWDMLQTLQDKGLRIQLTTSLEHTIQRVRELFMYYQDPVHQSGRVTHYNPQVESLMAIPGVSQALALKLASHFPSIRSVADASVKELQGCPLIGAIRAESIFNFFRKGENPLHEK